MKILKVVDKVVNFIGITTIFSFYLYLLLSIATWGITHGISANDVKQYIISTLT